MKVLGLYNLQPWSFR